MITLTWLQALSGLGLFLFALRFLRLRLADVLIRSGQLRLNRWLARPWACLLTGMLSTAIVQASSITVRASSVLINYFRLSLEQGLLVVLGASVGTSLKIWIFPWLTGFSLGTLLVGVCGIGLLLFNRRRALWMMEVGLAIGLTFWGLESLVRGLRPVIEDPMLGYLFGLIDGASFSGQTLLALLGCLLAALLQSGTVVLFLVFMLVNHADLSLVPALAVCLGATVGTSLHLQLGAIKEPKNVRRLMMGHFLIQVTGLYLALILFGPLVSLTDWITPGVPEGDGLIWHLVVALSLYTFAYSLLAYFLLPLLTRLLFLLIPGTPRVKDFFLNPVVRRMLLNSPRKALEEVDTQQRRLLELLKQVTDHCFDLFTGTSSQRLEQGEKFAMISEGLYELMVRLSAGSQLDGQQQERLGRQLQSLHQYQMLYEQANRLQRILEDGLFKEHYLLPPTLQGPMQAAHLTFNQLWVAILVAPNEAAPEDLEDELAQLATFLGEQALGANHTPSPDWVAWFYRCLGQLQLVTHQLQRIYSLPKG